MERVSKNQFRYIELRSFRQRDYRTMLMSCLITPERSLPIKAVVKNIIIYHIDTLFQMRRPCCRRVRLTSPVIQTESKNRRLLDFCDKDAAISSMNRSRLDLNDITFPWSYDVQHIQNGTIVTSVIKLLSRHFLIETTIDPGIRSGIHHIP